ncbi:unnamed protein product [Enterobius vermicularis]|uniref:Nucleotid_trans domain-containing protein n=1 Tax=Enterobius vermicularis TaxID=51028 RepID=A0A0N4VN46_ENTVE|nr:unnamed protein product [Enterobius vermicularis]
MISTLSNTEPTLILILNNFAVDMTLNWLCNTKNIKGVHERSLIVALDPVALTKLSEQWPNVKQALWNVPCLQSSFNRGDGNYQLFYLFRSTLAEFLLDAGKPFWMIQQDTFWRKSLLDVDLTKKKNADLIFDLAGDNLGGLIAGGYYLARPTNGSRQFFRQLSNTLLYRYVPDNTLMSSLCATSSETTCDFLDFSLYIFSIITNWIWVYQPTEIQWDTLPFLIQFDGDNKLGTKLMRMREIGFYFLSDDGITCNATAVDVSSKMQLYLICLVSLQKSLYTILFVKLKKCFAKMSLLKNRKIGYR